MNEIEESQITQGFESLFWEDSYINFPHLWVLVSFDMNDFQVTLFWIDGRDSTSS